LFLFLISRMLSTCTAHLIPLYLVILITYGEEYKLWRALLCNFFQPSVTSSLLGPNMLLSTLLPSTNLCDLQWRCIHTRFQVGETQQYDDTTRVCLLFKYERCWKHIERNETVNYHECLLKNL
jgi:hypothetical protein